MADSTVSPGASAGLYVIRCTECHMFVPADRVRHREERVRTGSPPAPGRWRAGGPPIFRSRTTLVDSSGPEVQFGPPSRYDNAIEHVPVCVDCLRRQRIGLYGVCTIAAACCALAVALYRGEEGLPAKDHQVAVVKWDSSRAPHATATPTPAATAITSGAPSAPKHEAGALSPMWQPILDAAAGLFATASVNSTPLPEPTPNLAATSQTTPPPVAVASARRDAAPTEADVPARSTPTEPTAGGPDSASAASAPDFDVGGTDAGPSPIWATEPPPKRKLAKATPAVRHDAPAATNVVAMRNDGYAALQERRYREALSLLQHATMMGDSYAPMYIGQIFEKGIGVARDVGQASYWYGIAIDRGNGAALAAFNRLRVNPY